MKKIVILLCMFCAALSIKAQIVSENWYSGSLVFSAANAGGGKIVMNAMAEGEEHEFMLVPTTQADGVANFRVGKSPNDYMMDFKEGTTVKHFVKEGLDVLCFYNSQTNQLEGVMKKEYEEDSQQLNIDQWLAQIRGTYTKDDGTTYILDNDKARIGGTYVPLEVVTFNGTIIGILKIDEKDYEVEPTIKGLHLYETKFSEDDSWWKRTGKDFMLTKSTRDESRFDFASSVLLNGGTLRRYDKPTLRLMRNAILARHGYRFQSQDLQDYFGSQPWYKPADSNDNIKLSFIEELNVDLIKLIESQSD